MSGWGRAGWGEGPWGQPASVPISFTISGVAATSALGSVSVDAEANVTPSTLVATSAVGSISIVAKANDRSFWTSRYWSGRHTYF